MIIGARDAAAGEQGTRTNSSCRRPRRPESVTLDVNDPSSVQAAAERDRGRAWAPGHPRANNAGILPEAHRRRTPMVSLSLVQLFEQTFRDQRLRSGCRPSRPSSRSCAGPPRPTDRQRLVHHGIADRPGSCRGRRTTASWFRPTRRRRSPVNGLTVLPSKRLSGTAYQVNSVCPGLFQTELTPASTATSCTARLPRTPRHDRG